MIVARGAIVGVLLLGPTALAFFSGGYFDRARLVGGIVAWLAAAAAAVVGIRVWPRARTGRLTLIALIGYTVWTIASIAWAPLGDAAQAEAERVFMYLGVVVAGACLLRERRMARAVEPLLAAGATIVLAEGLSERVLPGVFHLARSADAVGRLEQPLTYWNSVGLLAAFATVLLARLAGDRSRGRALRVAAAAAAPVTVLAIYLTLSRGAMLAATVGLVVLLLLDSSPDQLRGIAVVVLAGLPPLISALVWADLRTLGGPLDVRERHGLALLLVIVMSGLLAAASQWRLTRGRAAPASLEADPLHPQIRRVALAGAGLAVLATVVVALITATGTVTAADVASASSKRLVTTESVRGNFWRVAADAFVAHPLAGTGAGGFEVEWSRHRTIQYSARNAHSLYLETLSDLGIVGGLLLLAVVAGAAASARRARRFAPRLTVGWIAGLTMWAVHAGFDWDWQMPAATLPAAVLLAAVIASADAEPAPGGVDGRGDPGRRPQGLGDGDRMITRAVPRLVLLGVAVAGLIWLVHDLRAAVLDAHGRGSARTALSGTSVSSADVARATAQFAAAAGWNADPAPRLDEARLLLAVGRNAAARRLLERVVSQNPGSSTAWALLADATVTSAPARAEQALEELRSLYGHPPGAGVERGFLLSPRGVAEIVPGRIIGQFEASTLTARGVQFVGWAGAPLTAAAGGRPALAPPSGILVVSDGRVVATGSSTIRRHDVERLYPGDPGVRTGFRFTVPRAALTRSGTIVRGALYAVSGDLASRLPVSCNRRIQVFACGRVRAVPLAIVGQLDRAIVTGGRIRLIGWAATRSTVTSGRLLGPVRVLEAEVGGRVVATGRSTLRRSDVLRVYPGRPGLRIGFQLTLPLSAVQPGARMVLYAVGTGVRVRLPVTCTPRVAKIVCP